jgi:hypothetical protein
MYFHQVPRNRKPEPEPTVLASRSTVGLTKSIKDVRQKLFINALPGIRHSDFNCTAGLHHLHAHAPATLSKLHRIRQEIPNHLLEPVCVTGNHSGRRIEIRFDTDTLRVCSLSHDIDRILHHRHHFQRVQIEIKVTGDDARNVEDVVDDLRLRLRVPSDRLDSLLHHRIVERTAFE